jgi:hypothetical protein
MTDTTAIDQDILNGLSMRAAGEKHGVGQAFVLRRRHALGLVKKGKPAKRTPAQIMADLAAQAEKERAGKERMDALIATRGEIEALLEWRAVYGPKAPHGWPMAQVVAMYQEAVK